MRRTVFALLLVACSKTTTESTDAAPPIDDLVLPETTTELKIEDVVAGGGLEVQKGDHVAVLYTGKLTNGIVFDASSSHENKPLEFDVGSGRMIKAWDEGLLGMKVGGKRKLTVPSRMGYGERGVRGRIPPNATLLFDLELVDARRGAPKDGG